MELNKVESGALDSNGGAKAEQMVEPQIEEQQEVKTVNWEDHQRVLSDMHKYKTDMKDLKAEAEKLRKDKKSQEEAELKRTNNWKTIAEQREEELNEVRGKLSNFEEGYIDNEKFNALRDEAVKQGMSPDAIPDLHLYGYDGVEVERTDQGRVIVHGAAEKIGEHKKARPYLFPSPGAPNFNSGGATRPIQELPLTPELIVNLERRARQTGKVEDRNEYLQALKRFKEARGA